MSFEQLQDKIESSAVRNVANHWNDARGARPMPAWSDIKPGAIARQLPIIWSWKYNASADSFEGRLSGDKIIEALGGNLRGQDAEDFFKDRGGKSMVDRMRRVVSGPCFFYGKGAVFTHTKRVVLPLSEDGATADGILGITTYHAADLSESGDDFPTSEISEFISL